MTRYHLTKNGNIPFSPEEEAEFDALQSNKKITLEKIAVDDARQKRNQLLKDSDWTQMPDYSGANKADWATYRQLLRDLPAQSGFPTTINWPVEP